MPRGEADVSADDAENWEVIIQRDGVADIHHRSGVNWQEDLKDVSLDEKTGQVSAE